MTATWTNGNWKVNGATAISPNNNTQGAINAEYASPSIPDGTITSFDVIVSGAAIQTAFGVGVGVPGSNLSNQNEKFEGKVPSSGTFIDYDYNGVVRNNGNWVRDPADNADWAKNHGAGIAAPNTWGNGSDIHVTVNRINQTVDFKLNGADQGTYSIKDLGHQTLDPYVTSWFRAGPKATIKNFTVSGGGSAHTTTTTPASSNSGGSTTSSAFNGTVTQPATLEPGVQRIGGHVDNTSEQVSVEWNNGGWVAGTVNPNGNWHANVNFGAAGTKGTLKVREGNGPAVAEFSGTVGGKVSTPSTVSTATISQHSGSTSTSMSLQAASGNVISGATIPTAAGNQRIGFHVSDPTAHVQVYLDPNGGTPPVHAAFQDVAVSPNGNAHAVVNVGHGDTLWVEVNGHAPVAEWKFH